MPKAAIIIKMSFIFVRVLSICTSRIAISTGAKSPVKLLIADRLSGAEKPEMTAAMQKSNKPASMPLTRYEKFLLQRCSISQMTQQKINADETKVLNEDISTVLQIGRLYMLSVILDGGVAVCTVGPSVNVVRSTIMEIHKANTMYSKNTIDLLLESIELIGGFIIL